MKQRRKVRVHPAAIALAVLLLVLVAVGLFMYLDFRKGGEKKVGGTKKKDKKKKIEKQKVEHYAEPIGQKKPRQAEKRPEPERETPRPKNVCFEEPWKHRPIPDNSYVASDCPQRRINCHGAVPGKKGRALVLYHMTAVDSLDEWDPSREDNMQQFFRLGISSENESTELFDGVDYVIVRANRYLAEYELCHQFENVRLLWTPTIVHSTCSLRHILRFLGYDDKKGRGSGDVGSSSSTASVEEELSLASWPYRQVIVLSDQLAGPFVSENSSHWVDIVSMASQPYRPSMEDGGGRGSTTGDTQHGEETPRRFSVSSIGLFSWEGGMFHVQPFLLSIPRAALRGILDSLTEPCSECTTAAHCGGSLQAQLGRPTINKGSPIHSLAQNITLSVPGSHSEEEQGYFELFGDPSQWDQRGNPSLRNIDPCRAVFVELKPELLAMPAELYHPRTKESVRRLRVKLGKKQNRTDFFQSIVADTMHCRFFFL